MAGLPVGRKIGHKNYKPLNIFVASPEKELLKVQANTIKYVLHLNWFIL